MVPILDAFAENEPDLTRPYRQIAESGYPLVFVDRSIPGCTASLVASDNLKGGRMATDYLIRQEKCRTIFVMTPVGSQACNERTEGCRSYMRDRFGPNKQPSVQIVSDPEEFLGFRHPLSDVDLDSVVAAAEQHRVGIFATTNFIAKEIVHLLKQPRYRKIRQRIRLVGFGDLDLVGDPEVPITTIRQDFYHIGDEAVRLAIRLGAEARPNYRRKPLNSREVRTDVVYDLAWCGWPPIRATWPRFITGTLPIDQKRMRRRDDDDGPGRLLNIDRSED